MSVLWGSKSMPHPNKMIPIANRENLGFVNQINSAISKKACRKFLGNRDFSRTCVFYSGKIGL